jgi:ubiquinone/menaquinone biosynthesis C-methylase UbiE
MTEAMDARLQLRVQRYGWDRAAEVYDRAWSRQLAPAQALLLEMAGVQQGERVLEVACGSGLVTRELAGAVGPGGRVVASDLSEGMLERARRAVADAVPRTPPSQAGPAKNPETDPVTFVRLNAEALDLPDDEFDAAVCALGLMYVPDPGAALREMTRVLRPGGRVVAAVWGERRRCGWADIFPIVDARVNTEVCPLFFQLGTGDTLADRMQEAGLEEIRVRRLPSTLEYATAEEALEAAFAGGPVAMAYSRFDEEVRAQVHLEYLESIAPYRTPEGYRIPGEFVVARGIRPRT